MAAGPSRPFKPGTSLLNISPQPFQRDWIELCAENRDMALLAGGDRAAPSWAPGMATNSGSCALLVSGMRRPCMLSPGAARGASWLHCAVAAFLAGSGLAGAPALLSESGVGRAGRCAGKGSSPELLLYWVTELLHLCAPEKAAEKCTQQKHAPALFHSEKQL